jgi:head-tail adaptor
MLSIGQLDRRIEVQAPVYTTNSYGEETKTFEDATYTLWAHVDWKASSRKRESNEQVQGTEVIFYVRNLGVTILGTYRITYDSKTYIILGIKEIDGREKFLELSTKLKDNN